MATPSVSWQDKFSTTLSSGITASDTTIPLTALPTATEGYLVIEPDSSTAYETIYYTSKTGSAVVCPSAAAGRGVGGTAASHSSGATVRMDTTAQMLNALQDGTGLVGLHTWTSALGFDFVASGCVWSGDAYGSTRAASMTSGVVFINGRRHTVATVTARTFTASKDTYIDLLYSTVDNIATPVYTEVNNNAASPALASNSVRIGIIVTGAGNIANAGSVNQGQEDKVLPIASSVPYTTTDSLGNLICPRDPQRRLLGLRRITGNDTATSPEEQIVGLSVPVIVPTARKVKITISGGVSLTDSGAFTPVIRIWEGTVGSGTQLSQMNGSAVSTDNNTIFTQAIRTPSSSSVTYNGGLLSSGGGTATINASSTAPCEMKVELE